MKNTLFLIFLSFCLNVQAQKSSAELKEKTPFNLERFVGVDKFNSFYGIKSNTFYKLEGAKKYQFADLQLGTLTSADILNPLKITLFYKDMNTVVILDNRLNEISRINFTTIINFRNVGFATTGKDRSIWIFNIDLQQLELFDYNTNKILYYSQPITAEILQQKSNFNFCWLLQPKKIEFYNSYGSFMNSFEIPEDFQFSESNNLLVGKNKEGWLMLNKQDKILKPLSVSEIAVKDFYLSNENLYIYADNFIYRYQLNLSKE